MTIETINGTNYEVLKTKLLPNGSVSYAIKGLKKGRLYFTCKLPNGQFNKVYGGI